MANYYGTCRTNYFRVADEAAYQELYKGLVSEYEIEDFTEADDHGTVWHGFGSYGSISFIEPRQKVKYLLDSLKEENIAAITYYYKEKETEIPDEELADMYVESINRLGDEVEISVTEDPTDTDSEYNFGLFTEKLQKILPDNEAFIYMESGYEKLRYVTGYSVVVTKAGVKYIDIVTAAVDAARELLNNKEFNTKTDY